MTDLPDPLHAHAHPDDVGPLLAEVPGPEPVATGDGFEISHPHPEPDPPPYPEADGG